MISFIVHFKRNKIIGESTFIGTRGWENRIQSVRLSCARSGETTSSPPSVHWSPASRKNPPHLPNRGDAGRVYEHDRYRDGGGQRAAGAGSEVRIPAIPDPENKSLTKRKLDPGDHSLSASRGRMRSCPLRVSMLYEQTASFACWAIRSSGE